MISTASFAHLVGLIYDAAVDAERWPAALQAVRRELGYHHAILALHEFPSGQVMLDQTVDIPSPWDELRMNYYDDAVAVWGGVEFIQRYPVDRPAVLSRVSPGAMNDSNNRWVAEWSAPQGIVDHLALVLARDGGAIGCIGMGRHRDAGLIGQRDADVARLLIPHLQRAAAIGRVLQLKSAAAADLGSLLDKLANPVLLLSTDGAVLYANAAANDFLATGTPLAVRDGRLSSPQPQLVRSLMEALERCKDDGAGLKHGGFGLPARDAAGGVHALHLLPLGRGKPRPQLVPRAAAALFVSAPQARPGCAADLLSALYGLTPAEARVCEKVTEGYKLAEVARLLGVSTSTVRTHLLRIFDKVGVRRQADLIRLAATMAVPLNT